ncbi:MAG TPA: urease accessory protein UreE [Hyphomicrobiaceae bacterium]|nr:urease accessory protein UreE [Hyphomicrobiaceae bacterium]
MLRAVAVQTLDSESGPVLDSITLEYRARCRRRGLVMTDTGRELMLDLGQVTRLRDGEVLALESGGGCIRVHAALEDLLEVRAPDRSSLARLAWHIGNRHVPAEIAADAIYIEADHVLEEMLIGLGAETSRVRRPFEPEGGAYAGHHRHHSAASHER